MIKNIIDLLQYVEGETTNIQIARGKYTLPRSIKKAFKKAIIQNKWQKKESIL